MMLAITRQISPIFDQCELTHLDRTPINIGLANRQHAAYEAALTAYGYRVISLEPSAELPDSVFVEDTALVFQEVAVLTRPGARSRRLETEVIASALAPYRDLAAIKAPGVMDGGDVLTLDRQIFVGISARTNREAVDQLAEILAPWNYQVNPVPVTSCLHLKSAVTRVGEAALLINPAWVNAAVFTGWQLIEVDLHEPGAANALYLGDAVIFPSAYPRTLKKLKTHGISVKAVDVSEVIKAEGGVTCCSLIIDSVDHREDQIFKMTRNQPQVY